MADENFVRAFPFDPEYVRGYLEGVLEEMTGNADPEVQKLLVWLGTHGVQESALSRFNECGGEEEPSPLERLRFFCSLAMNGQDWLDVEPFFDALSSGVV